MRMWVAAPQFLIPSLIAPFVFTLVALVLFNGATSSFGLYAVLGGGMMGMWANTLYGTGAAIEAERNWLGTIEYVIATPARFIFVVLGRAIANGLTGLANIVCVLLVAQFVFEVNLGIAHPFEFGFELLITLVSLSALGLVFASVFTLSRSTQVASNGLEFPLYVISGTMFPIALLHPALQPFSYALGATWGVIALRLAAVNPSVAFEYYFDTFVNFASIFVYFAIAWILFGVVEKKMLRQGLLSRS